MHTIIKDTAYPFSATPAPGRAARTPGVAAPRRGASENRSCAGRISTLRRFQPAHCDAEHIILSVSREVGLRG